GLAQPGTDSSNGTSVLAPPTATNGPGSTGHAIGTLNFVADDIVFGYASDQAPSAEVPLNRLMLGFSAVNFEASNQISANAHGTLSVYESQANYGQPGTGGNLNLVTP